MPDDIPLDIRVTGLDDLAEARSAVDSLEESAKRTIKLQIDKQFEAQADRINSTLSEIEEVSKQPLTLAIDSAAESQANGFTGTLVKMVQTLLFLRGALELTSRASKIWGYDLSGALARVTASSVVAQKALVALNAVTILTQYALGGVRIAGRRLAESFAGGLQEGLKNVGGGLANVAKRALLFNGALQVAVLATTGFVVGLGASVAILSSLVGRLDKVAISARRLGTSTDFIQQISFAADQAGTSFQTLESIARTTDLSGFGQGFETQLRNISDHLATFSVQSERAAEAQRIFGRRGLEILPLLEGGTVALDQYAAEFERTGNRIDASGVETAKRVRDQFNIIKTTISGSFNSLVSEGLPILEEFTDKTVLLLNNTVVPAFKAASATVGAFTDTLQTFGLITEPASQELQRLAHAAGLTKEEFEDTRDALGDSGGRGLLGTLKEYFTTTKDINSILDENRSRQDAQTEAYLRQRVALRENALSTSELGSSIGIDLNQQMTLAQQNAIQFVDRMDEVSQRNAEARVNTAFYTGALFDNAMQTQANVTANEALSVSLVGVVNDSLAAGAAINGLYTAQQRLSLAEAGFGDVVGTAPGGQLSTPGYTGQSRAFRSVGTGGRSSASAIGASASREPALSSTLEYALARATGTVVQSDFPISMEEAISAATTDWNMRQTNEGTLELLQRGETHLQTVIDDARTANQTRMDFEQSWRDHQVDVENINLQVQRDQLAAQKAQLEEIKEQRRSLLTTLLSSGASAEAIQNVAVYGRGQDGSYGVVGRGIDAAFGGQQQQTARIELDGEVLGEFVTRTMVNNERSGVTSIGSD